MSLLLWLPAPMFLEAGKVSVPGSMFLLGGFFLCLCPGAFSLGVSVQGMYVWASLSRGDLCLGFPLCPLRFLSGVSVSEPSCAVKSGQYASYWNAFLIKIELKYETYTAVQKVHCKCSMLHC